MPILSPSPSPMPATPTSPSRAADRWGGALGLVAALGNVAGVALLREVPGAYRPDRLGAWLAGTASHPRAVEASAVAFVLGLLAMAGWAAALRHRAESPSGRLGLAAVATGAIVNAAGCVAPLVLARHVLPACPAGACEGIGRAMLGVTLSLDALFNGLLGVGLLVACAPEVVRARGAARALAALGALAGLASLPVALQYRSAAAAALLALAGPLWLAYLTWTSVGMLLATSPTRPSARRASTRPALTEAR